jgi:diadenosine tetraphosphate (Ap4A) HIT family hydrolase
VSAAGCRACLGHWPDQAYRIADLGSAVLYLHDDPFFTGWTVLVLRRHATELYELTREERAGLIDEVSRVAQALTTVYDARKINYALLGNQLPHIHWHLMPRLAGDPVPEEPVWTLRHEPHRLAPAELAARIAALRRALGG